MRVVDFFCGCGGASEGLRMAGMTVSLGIDFDEKAAASYRENFPDADFITNDIRKIKTSEVVKKLAGNDGAPLLLAVCAPCQPFSSQNKNKSDDDSRKSLLGEVHRFVLVLEPEYILLENVPGIQKFDSETEGPLCKFIRLLEQLEYSCVKFIANAEDYGVPQRRKRMVLLATRLGKIDVPAKTHGEGLRPFATVRDYIEDYPPLEAGKTCSNDPLHMAARMNELNIERIRTTPEGGDRRDWPRRLLNDCHKNYAGHTDTYGRMSWDLVAPTLTTKCNSYTNGRFGHPDVRQSRAISIREASRLQTFPKDFRFVGSISYMAKQIGNAVPCELARQFGLAILEHYVKFKMEINDGEN